MRIHLIIAFFYVSFDYQPTTQLWILCFIDSLSAQAGSVISKCRQEIVLASTRQTVPWLSQSLVITTCYKFFASLIFATDVALSIVHSLKQVEKEIKVKDATPGGGQWHYKYHNSLLWDAGKLLPLHEMWENNLKSVCLQVMEIRILRSFPPLQMLHSLFFHA